MMWVCSGDGWGPAADPPGLGSGTCSLQPVTDEPRHEKTCLLGFSTKNDINQAIQPQKMARGLKF